VAEAEEEYREERAKQIKTNNTNVQKLHELQEKVLEKVEPELTIGNVFGGLELIPAEKYLNTIVSFMAKFLKSASYDFDLNLEKGYCTRKLHDFQISHTNPFKLIIRYKASYVSIRTEKYDVVTIKSYITVARY
jgi:hypothetical protein